MKKWNKLYKHGQNKVLIGSKFLFSHNHASVLRFLIINNIHSHDLIIIIQIMIGNWNESIKMLNQRRLGIQWFFLHPLPRNDCFRRFFSLLLWHNFRSIYLIFLFIRILIDNNSGKRNSISKATYKRNFSMSLNEVAPITIRWKTE